MKTGSEEEDNSAHSYSQISPVSDAQRSRAPSVTGNAGHANDERPFAAEPSRSPETETYDNQSLPESSNSGRRNAHFHSLFRTMPDDRKI